MTTRAEADRIDARGMRCPWPALQLGKRMRLSDDAPGTLIAIIADDPRAGGELRAVAAARGWTEIPSGTEHEYRFTAPERMKG